MANIDSKNFDRRASDRSQSNENCAAPNEMCHPLIDARMKEASHTPRFWINASDVGPLMVVTRKASQREILMRDKPTMLLCYYVIDFVDRIRQFLRHHAIFAP